MASGWIVKRNNKEQGPFTPKQLKQLASTGQLKPSDQVRQENSERFYQAEKVKGLFDSAPAKQPKKQELLVAEVVEVIDDKPKAKKKPRKPEGNSGVLELTDEDFDDDHGVMELTDADFDDDDGYEDYEDYEDDYDDFDDYDSSPRRSRSSTRRPPKRQGGASSRPKRTKSKKKKASVNDDDDDGPWSNLIGGLVCFGIGIGMFVWIGPGGAEITGRGVIVWLIMFLNKIGGRWAILIFFSLAGIYSIVDAIKKFSQQ